VTDLPRTIVLVVVWAIFALVSLLPTTSMIVGSFITPTNGVTLEAYRGLLSDTRQWDLLRTSLRVAGGAAAVAATLGVPLGFALARVRLPAAGLWRIILSAPLVVPPYVMALAWTHVTGPSGPLSAFVSPAALGQWTYSPAAAGLVLGISFFPVVMLGTEAVLRRLNGRVEDAARLVAPPFRVLSRVTLPLAAPAISATLLIVFALALNEFGVPGLLRVRVYTTEVFTAFSAFYDFARATALTTPLITLVLSVAAAATYLVGFEPLSSPRPSPAFKYESVGARRFARVAVTVAATVSIIGPMAVLAWDARMNANLVVALRAAASPAQTSILVGVVVASFVVMVASIAGHARARLGRGAWWMDLLCMWLFAMPGTVIGVGLIQVWNRPGLGEVYGTAGMLVLASAARFLPLGVLLVGAAGRQLSRSIEEAAVLSGASWFRTWRHIWVPQVKWTLAAVWGVTFVLSFGELGASVLVIAPGAMTLPVHVYTTVANAAPGQLSWLALVQAGVGIAGLAIVAAAVSRGRTWSQ
jgi:iron(III) transport system permease protein